MASLNSNFYGPAVPPPGNSHRGRRILCTILKIVIAFVVTVGILLLILGLVYRPSNLKFDVTGAHLTQFDITGNQLYYKLALNVTIRNPNERYRVYYDTTDMTVLYKNKRLETHRLPAFFQDTKTTDVLSLNIFEGQQLVFLGGDEVVEFNAEKSAGVYHIDVKFFFRLRMKSGEVVLKLKPKVHCGLKVPLINDAQSFVFFPNTACDFSF